MHWLDLDDIIWAAENFTVFTIDSVFAIRVASVV